MKREIILRMAIRSLGGALAIGLMEFLAAKAGEQLMMVPFATSIVMVMGMPEALPARPRALVGGHIISAAAGIFAMWLLGDALWVSAVGVGLAMLAMQATDTMHPPAGINPIIAVTGHATPFFVIVPVAAGALILIAFAFLFHRLSGESWPEKW